MLLDNRPRRDYGRLVGGVVTLGAAIGLVVLVTAEDLPVDQRSDAGPDAPVAHATTTQSTPAPADERPAPPAPRPLEFEGRLERNQTLGAALAVHGLGAAVVNDIVHALRPHFDFRHARPGAEYSVRLRSGDEALAHFRFVHGPIDVFEVSREASAVEGEPATERLLGRRVEIPTRTAEVEVGAEIRFSLHRALQRVGENPALAALIVDVFAWDIDFYKNTHPGDRFRVIVEKVYRTEAPTPPPPASDGGLAQEPPSPGGNEAFVRYGRVLAAEYAGKVGTFQVFWFQPDPDAPGRYFLGDGQSAEKTFLATPLKFARISSGYSKSRKHPVLGYNKAHLGVDFAAPTGTPVWAMARGKVRFAAFKGANGNLVVIDHDNGLQSLYAHLHRIAPGIKPGALVEQKQVIGQVGTTGRSTGPHLHFAIKRRGKYLNPESLKMTRAEGVPARHRAAFKEMVAARLDRLRTIPVLNAPAEEPEDDDEAGP